MYSLREHRDQFYLLFALDYVPVVDCLELPVVEHQLEVDPCHRQAHQTHLPLYLTKNYQGKQLDFDSRFPLYNQAQFLQEFQMAVPAHSFP